MSKILLIEDNLEIMNMNASMLNMYGYEVLCAESLKQADELLSVNEPDMIVLDIMLPDGNGLAWCKKLKERRSIPVLFLSALNENADIVAGLKAGGDDYLPKPYGLDVLLARVETRLQATKEIDRYISFGELKLDTFSQTAAHAHQQLFLTQKEYAVLLLIMRYGKNDQGISKQELYETVWGQPLEADSNALWTIISRLKTKLSECNSGITVSFSKYNGTVTDQYGTYNAFTMFGAPTLSLHAIDDDGNSLPQYDRFVTRLDIYNFKIDTQGLKNYLNSNGGHNFTYLLKVEFRTDDGVKSSTLKKEYRYTVMGPDGPEFAEKSRLILNTAGITLSSIEDSVFSLSVAEVQAIRGQENEVPVYVANNSGIWGVHAKLSYDTNTFELLGIDSGNIFAESGFVKQNDLTRSSVNFCATNTSLANLSTNGAIATLRFKVKENASEEKHTIGLEILQCVNVAGGVLTPETADGSITVNHVHDAVLTLHEGTPATCTENGRKAYYTCSNCDNLISAEDGTTVLTEADLVIEKTGHVYGEWLSDETGHWHECACGEKTNTEAHTPGDEATSTTPQTCTECGYVIEPANGDSTLREIIKKTLVTVIVLCHRLFRWIFNLIVNICQKI